MNASAAIFGIIIMALVVVAIVSVPVWLLWNWLMPTIFGIKTISLLQALGLTLLSHLLFASSATKTK